MPTRGRLTAADARTRVSSFLAEELLLRDDVRLQLEAFVSGRTPAWAPAPAPPPSTPARADEAPPVELVASAGGAATGAEAGKASKRKRTLLAAAVPDTPLSVASPPSAARADAPAAAAALDKAQKKRAKTAAVAALRSLGSTLSEDKSSTAAEVWQEVQKLAKADHAAARAVVADARAQAGTDVTMGEKAVRLALKKGEAFSREDSKPPKYQLHE